ncbi:hypothetical protein SPBR_05610 [Sporothrix brasiliensis 5110]|uniref:Uncharacterized protein n=1 Tax=Sporothrix brasiliensis 5110 TaxID=1398154 RepID=A0A0C2F5H7_9PEZI|nr:uncharacterized protein SPBR_05610 [Sporothrix brasiliensis 5110]KIH94139.1 hypothetical protein SPBR_05610 [Sporothrix brasiliensis 5110]
MNLTKKRSIFCRPTCGTWYSFTGATVGAAAAWPDGEPPDDGSPGSSPSRRRLRDIGDADVERAAEDEPHEVECEAFALAGRIGGAGDALQRQDDEHGKLIAQLVKEVRVAHEELEDAARLLGVVALLGEDAARRGGPDGSVAVVAFGLEALGQDGRNQLERLADERAALALVGLEQRVVDLRHDLDGRLVMRNEVAEEHVGSVLVHRVVVANVLQDDVVVLDNHRRQLHHLHARVVDTAHRGRGGVVLAVDHAGLPDLAVDGLEDLLVGEQRRALVLVLLAQAVPVAHNVHGDDGVDHVVQQVRLGLVAGLLARVYLEAAQNERTAKVDRLVADNLLVDVRVERRRRAQVFGCDALDQAEQHVGVVDVEIEVLGQDRHELLGGLVGGQAELRRVGVGAQALLERLGHRLEPRHGRAVVGGQRVQDVHRVDDGHKARLLLLLDNRVAALDELVDVGVAVVADGLAVGVVQRLCQEPAVLELFNAARQQVAALVGIAVEVFVDGRTQRTMVGAAQLLLEVEHGVDDALLVHAGSVGQQRENAKDADNGVHQHALLVEHKRHPLDLGRLRQFAHVVEQPRTNLDLKVCLVGRLARRIGLGIESIEEHGDNGGTGDAGFVVLVALVLVEAHGRAEDADARHAQLDNVVVRAEFGGLAGQRRVAGIGQGQGLREEAVDVVVNGHKVGLERQEVGQGVNKANLDRKRQCAQRLLEQRREQTLLVGLDNLPDLGTNVLGNLLQRILRSAADVLVHVVGRRRARVLFGAATAVVDGAGVDVAAAAAGCGVACATAAGAGVGVDWGVV